MGNSSAKDNKLWVHYQAATKVARLLNKSGYDAYLVGGAVRDVLLGQIPKDFDLVTNAKPQQIIGLDGLSKAKHLDTAQAFAVTKVATDISIRGESYTGEVEVATYRRDIEAHLGRKLTKVEYSELEDDIQRRDFTINALALDLANDYLVDMVGGIDDLEDKVVRFIGESEVRIKEDPLRILRGIRLKSQLDFEYSSETYQALLDGCSDGSIGLIATERSRDELTRMLRHHSRRASFEELDTLGALKHLIPELGSTKHIDQPQELHAEGDVWTHTMLAIEALNTEPNARLAWATLLHDIGKPTTYQAKIKTGDRIRFSEHYKVGAQIATKVLSRLKFSTKFTSEVAWMINHHVGIDSLPDMRPKRADQMMAHPAFKDLLELHKADAQATWHLDRDGEIEVPEPDFTKLHNMYDEFLARRSNQEPTLKSELGIDGHWLKSLYPKIDGPSLGRLLDGLNEAYLDDEINSVEEAKAWIDKNAK